CLVIYFLFQAEDGIRARNVTGVQTCALPISWSTRTIPSSSRLYIAPEGQEATQLGFKQCSQSLGKYIINACSKLNLISSSIFSMFGSRGPVTCAPANWSSQFGPHSGSMYSPVTDDFARATGVCSTSSDIVKFS